ncbi:hypothetical protein PHLGIDRAFT_106557 [Phlebiopsis gigantea 11061_1 CR5-6]|uniref:ABC transporter n=1 Tax=Phlebiopsis gigantea (strain 11061_1 CR5-6) TaxID=745531 RepID=A0A0C3NNZ6_PHLG1|nr:hypothetical protein PHLGIDRAFT_106557 [Phlebiopsis gigantea 11061_1 CR5-6]
MPQLLESSLLAALAVGSAVSLTISTINHRGVKLLGVVQDAGSSDPLDVAQPEDVVDGEPIDEAMFWKRMRLRKMLLTLVLLATLALEIARPLHSADTRGAAATTACVVRIAFASYALLLAASSVGRRDTRHWTLVVHISCATAAASLLLAASAAVPSRDSRLSTYARCAPAAAYLLSCAVAITIPRGPPLHYPSERIYSDETLTAATSGREDNVCGSVSASVLDTLLFSYATKVVTLGTTAGDFEAGDLPLVPARMRAVYLFAAVRAAADARGRPRLAFWRAAPGRRGWGLAYRVVRVNAGTLAAVVALAAAAAGLFYAPSFFLQRVVRYVEGDPARTGAPRGLLFSAGLFVSSAAWQLVTGQLWSIATTTLQVRMRVQLNSLLFAKTLVRKDVASPLGADGEADAAGDEEGFSSKAQVMNLMTTDADRVSRFSSHLYALVDAPIEVAIGTFFLYKLLGVSCFYGLALTFIFLPLNHFAGSLMVGTEEKLMKARDERVGLMNEILGGIRMLKFMAWERSFEARVMKIRKWELQNQHRVYIIETLWSCMWNGSPIIITLVSLWHFSVYREQVLTPSIAFTAISVFQKMKSALNVLPETFINMLQCFVSLRRIEKYLHAAEITHVRPLARQVDQQIILQSATIAWPRNGNKEHGSLSTASTPRHKFILSDLSLEFPRGELSLVCGKLGSGKTLLLLALLGEADLLTGRLVCPRSPPDALATFANQHPSEEEWIVPGVCAYVPQASIAWLRNTSIRDNILFELPFHEGRYQKTLEACALLSDLEILPDGDMSEIGERGVTLSGGQKARVSLARAVYSRASVLLLDDVLSAVDAHTAHHIFHTCLRGGLTRGRTVILVSHHVQLCAPEASYVVSLDNGRLAFAGPRTEFQASDVLGDLWRSGAAEPDDGGAIAVPDVEELMEEAGPSTVGDKAASPGSVAKKPEARPAPKKLVEEEKRAVGHVGGDVWSAYLGSYGGWVYWAVYGVCFGFAAVVPVLENGWLKIWSGSSLETESLARTPAFYMSGYAIVSLFLSLGRWFVLYHGGMRSSSVLYHRLLESVLFATLRFHDTVSRGRLLNRFGKDFESVDSTLPDFIGRTTFLSLNVVVTYSVMTIIGGPPFLLAAVILAYLYYSVGRVYGQTSRDLRRLDSITRSPLYSMYGETIAGVPVVRAFGASSKFMRDMLRCVDTNTVPYYWLWSVSRWVSVRFNLLSSAAVGVVAVTVVSNASISASTAGFALAFATSLTDDLLSLVQQFVGLEQAMVAVERIKEFTDLEHEPSEYIEPRPPAAWPSEGAIKCEDLAVRYAPDLPDVLKDLNFVIHPGEKVGVLGRTGSGKSTLALSFFRFVEPTNGRILVDGVDISQIGLADLRSRLTIIPQDPTILSGTLRTTLDVFGEYEDADIYEALRRVHLIPTGDNSEDANTLNANVFQNLESPVSEGGDNLSTGEKQLLCMARAILKRTRVLLMDEVRSPFHDVDYATDELIGKTIRQEFACSTILTIAHRLRTIIDYDRVMLLDQGRIVEFDRPAALLANPDSMFYALCKATGQSEFAVLTKMAGIT